MMPDAERIHPAAQNFAVAVVAYLAEDADVESQHTGPAKMVEHYATDRRWFGGGAVAARVDQDLFVGADDPRRAIKLIDHHAAAADGVEFELSHPQVSGVL
jgi:hypothetical protein